MPHCEVTYIGNDLALKTPYDSAFVAALHARIPRAAHTWSRPYWLVDPAYTADVIQLIRDCFDEQITVTARPSAAAVAAETRALELRYLGRCKERGDGVSSAFGTPDGTSWTLVFPETVLRAHFGAQNQRSDEPGTLYSALGIAKTHDAGAIKQAYRRMARQWHPDVCKETDATQRFQAVQHAYSILADDRMRRKYDAGLALEASLTSTQRGANGWDNAASVEYRAPLRCGLVLAEGQAKIGRFHVSKIIDWQDIVRGDGKTMVSSWDSDAECVKVEWV